jgi:hypothetical protein
MKTKLLWGEIRDKIGFLGGKKDTHGKRNLQLNSQKIKIKTKLTTIQ